MTSVQCEKVELFADGELPPADAEIFRAHAATCARCEAELAELAQLEVLEHQYRTLLQAKGEPLVVPAPAPVPAPTHAQQTAKVIPFPSRARWIATGAVGSLAAMLLVMVGQNVLDRVPESAWYPGGTHRLTDARSAHSRARAYKPLKQGTLGGSGVQSLSGAALGKLEEAGDALGVAALHLARGTPGDAQEALRRLAELPDSADVLSERAYAYLVHGDPEQRDVEEALRLADAALAEDPTHPAALWNRALASKGLGLLLLAARDFEAVAALEEPGWKDEARARAQELRKQVTDMEKSWLAAIEAGKHLVATGSLPEPDTLRRAPILRHYFYDAVRVRASREDVLRLLPQAEKLDAMAGDTALASYVKDVASRDFTVRGPLARDYGRLANGDQSLDARAFLERLRASSEADLLLGVIAKLKGEQLSAKELQRLANVLERDAWLRTLALQLQAKALQRSGDAQLARTILEEALRACTEARLEYRCADVELELTYAFDRGHDLEEGLAHARHGWQGSVHARAWGRQVQFILELAQMTRQRGDAALARAYYEEALERERMVSEHQRFAHEGLAILDVQRLHFREARQHLDAALATGLPLGLTGALALSDVARVSPSSRDASVMEAFRAHPSGPPLGAGEQALALEALGRWTLELHRREGVELLNRAIQMATDGELALRDPDARLTLAYSYTALILDAGKNRDVEGALRLIEREWLAGASGALPERCLLAVTLDGERLLAIFRGAAGGPPTYSYDEHRTRPVTGDLTGLLPAEKMRAAFAGCATVKALARAPLYGRPGLLPSDIAWSYLSVRAPQGMVVPEGPGRHLVVQEVAVSPARRRLKSPPRWEVPEFPGERVEQLTERDATPSAVLRRMEDATDITFVTHALVNPDSDEAFLVLTPGPGGDTLKASDLQKNNFALRRHPLVVLASCKGAQPGPVLHEARSLPAAFLRAGARAVLAASDDVPDRDGPRFFAMVRERILTGAAPAEALRAVRAEWNARGQGAPWLEGVLLFQ